MHEQDYGDQQQFTENSPDPTRFAALAGDWRIEAHDDHPDHYVVGGQVGGEDFWESVGLESEAHIALRAGAISQLPAMLRQLTETYDLLLDMSLRGEIDGGDPVDEPENPDRTGERLRALMGDIGDTLATVERRGERLGLDSFAVVDDWSTGPVDGLRFSEHGAAYAHAQRLTRESTREAEERGWTGPVMGYFVVPARLVDGERHAGRFGDALHPEERE